MTAPFTIDPAALKPKRLRSDPSVSMGSQGFQVACGRAAHGGGNQPVVVVNLADGLSWLLPPALGSDVYFYTIGLTCDHVYLSGQFGGRTNIARIRLDSLGPGLPPD